MSAFTFGKVDQPRLCLSNFERLEQHGLQQRFKAGVSREAGCDLKKTAQGFFHALHGSSQLIDFQHWRVLADGVIEVKPTNGICFLHQRFQGLDQ